MTDDLVKRLRDECEDADDPIFMTRATLLKAADRIEELEREKASWKGVYDGAVIAMTERIDALEAALNDLLRWTDALAITGSPTNEAWKLLDKISANALRALKEKENG